MTITRIIKRCLFTVVIFAVAATTVFAQCELKPDEAKWLEGTMNAWNAVRKNELKLPASDLPWSVLFDEKCVHNINPDTRQFSNREGTRQVARTMAGEPLRIESSSHSGKIFLPDGQSIPSQLISFAANFDGDKRSFFVAALPSVWKNVEHLRQEKNVETLVRSVYIHELTHTYHRNFFARLNAIEKSMPDVDNFDDDIIQNIFSKNEKFNKAYTEEIALANDAVAETKPEKKRAIAKRLLDRMKQRRAMYYTGKDLKFAEIEDIFLTMEGVANWAACRAAIADGLSENEASRLIRRGGKHWSQEHGILLFMIIDSLSPNWQKAAFAKRPASIVSLLERAVR
jgi:hypothetical protein